MSFGPQFAMPEEFIVAGFRRVMAGVTGIPDATLDALLHDLVQLVCAGAARPEQAFHHHLEGIDFSWPWLDEWADRFLTAGEWPRLCQRYMAARGKVMGVSADRPAGPAKEVERERRFLLWHSILVATSMERSATLDLRPFLAGKARFAEGIHAALHPSEGAASAAEPYLQRLRRGDLSALPPNFPGDMTVVRLARRGESREPHDIHA